MNWSTYWYYQEGRDLFVEAGGQIADWSPEELAKMDELIAHMWDNQIANSEAKGMPAKSITNAYYSALEELTVEKPAIGYTPGG